MQEPKSQEQSFMRLSTIYDGEKYYLHCSNEGVSLLHEDFKDAAYENRQRDPGEWHNFIFHVYGPF